MISAGIGLGRGLQTGTMASEAATSAMRGCGAVAADLVVIFATPEHFEDEHALLGPLLLATRATAIVGCSASGVIAGNEELERESAIAVLAINGIDARSFIEPGPLTRGGEIATRMLGYAEGADALVLLPDALTFRPRALLPPLASLAAKVVGAAASGVGPGPTTWQIGGDRVVARAVAGACVKGARVTVGVTHAARPLGAAFEVSSSEGNIVFRLGDRSAVQSFRSVLPRALGEDVMRAAAGTVVTIGEGRTRADHVTRAIVGIDAEHETITLGAPVTQGSRLRFAVRDPAGAREDLSSMLGEIVAELERPPAFGLYFNDAGRGEALYGVPGIDTAYIESALGTFPLLGMFGTAEIGPTADGPDAHIFTGILALFH